MLLVLLGVACFSAVVFTPTRAVGQELKHVLVLHSYNKDLTWTDSEDRGIASVFQTRTADVEVHTEYLDTKLVSDAEHDRLFFELLKQKYSSIGFRVVIATDDDAYNFYLKHHEALFPGVPVVFCGVNYFNDAQRTGREDLVTGVVETFDVPGTLRTALRFHPSASRVVVINDDTTTGRANKQIITEEVIPQFSKDVSFEFYEDLTMAELLERVGSIPPDDIILLMTFNRDRAGAVYTYDRSIDLIAKEAKAPIYGVWDFYLGKGIVGGMLTSGADQGRIAAEMALRIVDGEPTRTIPIVRESPNRYKFDDRQLKRFGIRTSDLPEGNMVVGAPTSFYAANKVLVWVVATGFLGFTVTIVLLLLYISQRRRAEGELRDSEERFRTLVNNISIGVARTAPSGRYVQVNPAMASMLGYDTPELLMEAPVSDIYQDPADRERLLEELRVQGAVKNLEIGMQKRDGTPILVSLSVTIQNDEQGAIKWMDSVLEDITERKHAEEELREKDRAIRQAYSDVIDAATGGKLVLMTAEEIEAALGTVVLPPQRIGDAADLSSVRHTLREALESLTPRPRVVTDYILAASEAMTNALKHGSDGEFSIRLTPTSVQIVIVDHGPGIEFRCIPKATLVPGFSTRMSLGMGFTIMLEVTDRVLLATQPSLTEVALEVEFADAEAS